MASYKLKNKNAVGMMASSPLYETPNPLSEVSYAQATKGDMMASQKYQSKLRERAKTNPEGYFTLDDKLYDKKYYKIGGSKRYPAPSLNEGYTMDYEKGLQYSGPKNVDKKKDLSKTDPITKNIQKKEQSTGYQGTMGPKGGSIGNLPTTGNLQVQNFGDIRHTTLGHGNKKATGDQKLMKGPYEFVNTGKGKVNVPKAKTTDKKSVGDASSLVPKGGFGTGGRIGNTDALNFDPTKFGLNKDGSTKTKSKSTNTTVKKGPASTSIKPMQGLVDLGGSDLTQNISKVRTTVEKARSADHDLISSRPKSGGRVGRVARRQQAKTDRVLGRLENRAQIRGIRETERGKRQAGRESAKQERKNLLMNDPIPKDASGGRKSSQPKTGSQDFTGMKGDKPRQNQGFDYSKGGKSKRSKKKAQRGHEAQKYGI